MTLIRIQERVQEQGSFQAMVSFNHGSEYSIVVTNPFSEADEERLEWYFEEYLEFPFIKGVKVREAATSITTYGEALFKQVFADNPKVLVPFKNAVQAGLNTVQVEIAGSAQFHALHWEALKDPDLPQPLVLHAVMVRKNLEDQPVHAEVQSTPTIHLLVVAARPYGKRDMGYRTISRPLVDLLRQSSLPIQVEIVRPGTYEALAKHLERNTEKHGAGYYHVIHFDLHGALLTYDQLQEQQGDYRFLCNNRYGRKNIEPFEGHKAFLAFEGPRDNEPDPVEAKELADLLIYHKIPVAILNACQSGKQIGATETSLGSRLMQAGVQLVMAMGYSVTVSAAQLLMKTLYQQLFANDDLTVAIRHARTELYNHKTRQAYFDQKIDLEDWLLPVVYQNQPVRLSVRPFTADENKTYHEHKAEELRYTPAEPRYGFVGRDLDILQIEKRLLTNCNIVLVRGMGGAGKTTLLQHLNAWWRTTGFVKQVFYFGYDEKAWTRQQILAAIARRLLSDVEYVRDFQPLSLDAQQAMLTQRLRAENYLLILDNLESITGAHLAIKHTLSTKEQKALHSLLADLACGRTLILLGSRAGEDWLAKGTFDDNVYDLLGLDPEAASILADRILEKHHATKYRQHVDLQQLLKLLDGFPLALEVVLANLARQTPTEVLAALQAGDVTINVGDSEKRTENILRCIDYSHSNLSPQVQQLLLCLAPFTSVIDTNMLDNYTTHLRQQSALSALPFERWPEVIREAHNWGLLSPDSDNPPFLHLQPTLPYFLRTRLHAPEQAEMQHGIETAFRLHYDQVGGMLLGLLQSKDPKERQVGQVLTGLEYENLVTALKLALEAQVSIQFPYFTLSSYLDAMQDHSRGLELGQEVLKRLETYPSDILTGRLGAQFVRIIGVIANQQFTLRQYASAEVSYQRILELANQLEDVDEKEREHLKAGTHHQLGYVAQEQRQWQQAEQYYQQALQIFSEFNDRDRQADTYHQLGMVAQQQRQWQQAEQYYQQALQLKIESNAFYAQASTYAQLGIVAGEQQQWQQAEQYYQQALQIYIESNDRYGQAKTYHNLGTIAQQQRQWQQAEQYYQQALQLKIEYNHRYAQASTYHQLGRVAQEQQQWQQACSYFLQALEIFVEYKDNYNSDIVLRSLAQLWQASSDKDLPAVVAPMLGATVEETEALLREMLGEKESSEAKLGQMSLD